MTDRYTRRLWSVLILSALPLFAQSPFKGKHDNERITAIVPIVGAGTYADPKRPLFAPHPKDARAAQGIISFEWLPSDDGKYAVVEYVALDRKAFAPILSDSRVLESFEKGKVKKDDLEKAIKKYRKDFKFEGGEKQR